MSSDISHLVVALQSGMVLDGYRLLRSIGRGGFGEVWVCQSETTGAFRALKFLSAGDEAQMQREKKALIRYQKVSAKLHSPNLLPIEHVNRTEYGFFYTMPLADGMDACSPTYPQWKPKTLAALILARRNTPRWFGASEVRQIMLPLLEAVAQLSDAGMIHRDIKPDNILFVEDRVCLGDISLLGSDAQTLTQRGTPGYAAPSWYLESGGNPDMWGLATTFYTLVTGNAPDKMGRSIFRWPPQGESSVNRKEWGLFHQIILRATREKASERFLSIGTMREDLAEGKVRQSWRQKAARLPWKTALAVCALLLTGWGGWKLSLMAHPNPMAVAPSAPAPTPTPTPTPTQKLEMQPKKTAKNTPTPKDIVFVDERPGKSSRKRDASERDIMAECNARLAEAETLLPTSMIEMQRVLEHLYELLKHIEEDAPLPMEDVNATFTRMEQLWPTVQSDFKTIDWRALPALLRSKLVGIDAAMEKLPFNDYDAAMALNNRQERVKEYFDFFAHPGASDFYQRERDIIMACVIPAASNTYIKKQRGRDDEVQRVVIECRNWFGPYDQRSGRSKGRLESLR